MHMIDFRYRKRRGGIGSDLAYDAVVSGCKQVPTADQRRRLRFTE